MSTTIGILGAYGSTGRIIAKELIKEKNVTLLIGGRDQTKVNELLLELGKAAESLRVDIDNQEELDNFCRQSDIIINCAGPSIIYSEKVALSALKNNCNYIDPGGYAKLYDVLADYQEEIKNKGLYFVHSCGWIPGISEVFACYAHAIARQKMDFLEKFEHFYGDRNEWSESGLIDIIWHMHQSGRKPKTDIEKQNGNQVKIMEGKPAQSKAPFVQEIMLPAPFGKQKSYNSFPSVLKPLRSQYQQVSSYVMMVSLRTILTMMIIRLFYRNNEKRAVQALKKAFFKDCRKNLRGGGVADRIYGYYSGQKQSLIGGFFESRSYWLTGIASVITAKMMMNLQVKSTGAHHLCEAVDIPVFMNLLSKAGLRYQFSLNGTQLDMEV